MPHAWKRNKVLSNKNSLIPIKHVFPWARSAPNYFFFSESNLTVLLEQKCLVRNEFQSA